MGNIASTYKEPGVFITVDNSAANTATGQPFRTVLTGQVTAAGTATVEEIVQVFSPVDAQVKFGVGSMLAEMFEHWFANNTATEVWAIPLDDAAASVANVSSIPMTETATSSGTISIYVNNKKVSIGVADGDLIDAIIDALVAAVNAETSLPCTAANTASVFVLTAKNKGTIGNTISYVMESDVTGTIIPSIDVSPVGATDPDIADAIAALPDELYNSIVMPYTDATNLTALTTELERRWGALVQYDGVAICAFEGSVSTLTTKGDTLNSAYISMVDAGLDTKTPPYLFATMTAGQVSARAEIDPARPYSTLKLVGANGDTGTNRRTKSERNSLLNAGISTHVVGVDGSVRLGRMVTTYKTNAQAAPDTSYLNLNTLFNLSYQRQARIVRMLSLYPDSKLGDSGDTYGPGQAIATPAGIKGDYIALYEEFVYAGLAQDVDTYAESVVVTIDPVNVSRVNVIHQPKLIGQFYQIDDTMQFLV